MRKITSKFRKGQYIVITGPIRKPDENHPARYADEYKYGFIYKQKELKKHILPYNVGNAGNTLYAREDKWNWRFGTTEEVNMYVKIGKPVCILNVNNNIDNYSIV